MDSGGVEVTYRLWKISTVGTTQPAVGEYRYEIEVHVFFNRTSLVAMSFNFDTEFIRYGGY